MYGRKACIRASAVSVVWSYSATPRLELFQIEHGHIGIVNEKESRAAAAAHYLERRPGADLREVTVVRGRRRLGKYTPNLCPEFHLDA